MATGVRRFAEEGLQVERILEKTKTPGSPGRVAIVLSLANSPSGVTQKELVILTGLRKDVLSKLIAGLVDTKLITHVRDLSNPRIKRILLTPQGSRLLSQIEDSLRPATPATRPTPTKVKSKRPRLPAGAIALDFS